MATARPGEKALKTLFALSGNRCAFPGCPVQLVQGSTLIGKVCHIKAAHVGGPRYDAKQSPAARHGYGNLILLCGNHHTLVDDDEKTYTAERLQEMKAKHEGRVERMDSSDVERAVHLVLDESVHSVNQTGGITARNVTINVERTERRDPDADLLTHAAAFHKERVDRILRNEGPVAVLDGGMLVLHVVPASGMTSAATPHFSRISGNPRRFPPIGSQYRWESRIDSEGFFTGSNAEGLTEPQRAYVQVLRSGAVEAVVSSLARGRDTEYLVLPELEDKIVDSSRRYIAALNECGIDPPFAVSVSLADVRGLELLQGPMMTNAFPEDLPAVALRESHFNLGGCLFHSVPADDAAAARILRPLLDHLANCAGLPASTYFGAAENEE